MKDYDNYRELELVLIISFVAVVFITGLKFGGFINWNWAIITFPLWGSMLAMIGVIFITGLITFYENRKR